MASSVSGTQSLSSSLSSIRGYGGLASGLDRDTLIEQMTSGTQAKIAAQKQKQTKIQWTQEAIRNITSKIYGFTTDFTSYASSKNLTSTKLFSRNLITALGENSKYVSVSGTAASAENMSIARIKQLARNASMTASGVSTGVMSTGAMESDLSKTSEVSTIVGNSLYIKYGKDLYSVRMEDKEEYDYRTPQGAIDALNAQLATVNIGGSGTNKETLADVMEAKYDASTQKVTFQLKDGKENAAHGNSVMLAGGTGDILQDLGFLTKGEDLDDWSDEEKSITAKGLAAENDAKLTETQTLAQQLNGKQIAFAYNGTTKWITLDSNYTGNDKMDKLQKDLQAKLDEAFGKGRINVDLKGEDGNSVTGTPSGKVKFSFTTTKPDGSADKSSTLSMTAGEGILGHSGLFDVKAGVSNRVNQSANLAEAGLVNGDKFRKLAEATQNRDDPAYSSYKKFMDSKGDYNLVINGKRVEGINKDSTINDIINKINNTQGIGVKVEYQAMSDRFVLTATDSGASGGIDFSVDGVLDADGKQIQSDNGWDGNIARLLFGSQGDTEGTRDKVKNVYTEGQDAVLSVKYPGSEDEIEITRGSNTFSMDGLNVTLKGTFGYEKDEDGNFIMQDKVDKEGNLVLDSDGKTVKEPVKSKNVEEITFDASVDTEKAVEAVRAMVDSFNEILELVNKECKTKPDRDYSPLTDAQKEELSESEIEKWEAKAKEGLLFGDTDLRLMSDNLRAVINSGDRSALSRIGISVSSSYSDNGKLVLDEEAFKTALQSNPDEVMDLLNRKASTDANGNKVQAGLLTNIKNVMDKYGSMTGATKGILVERAGSIYAPTSVLTNSLQKQLDEIDDYLDRLADKLETETDRYISQFTQLETLISQMNNQSSYLSSMFS